MGTILGNNLEWFGLNSFTWRFLFRIDEVVTVQGQLKSIGGTVDVESPAGGRVSEVLFEDGGFVEKGDP